MHVLDVATGDLQVRLPDAGGVVGYLPDGNTLVTISGIFADAQVKFWDLPSGELRRTIVDDVDARVSAVALSSDGTRLAMSSPNAPATVWDIATATRIRAFPEKQKGCLALSPDSKVLAFAGTRTVTLWDIESGRKLAQDPHPEAVQAVVFSPDGKTLLSTSTGIIRLWDMTPAEETAIVANAPAPKSLRFDPSGRLLFVGSTGPTKIIDVAAGRETAVVPAGRVLAISADCNVFAAPLGREALAVYSRDGNEIERFPLSIGNDYHALRVQVSSDGKRLAAHRQWHGPPVVFLHDLTSGQSRTFGPRRPSCSVLCADLSPDGSLLAAGFQFQDASVWDVATGEEKLEVRQGSGMLNVLSIAFTPDGRSIATGADDGAVSMWDIASGEKLSAFRGHAVSVFALAFSPDGATLATGGQDETVRLWDVTTGQERCALPCPGHHIAHLRFSPDGTVLASANQEGTIRLWRAATDAEAGARLALSAPPAQNVALFTGTTTEGNTSRRSAQRRPDHLALELLVVIPRDPPDSSPSVSRTRACRSASAETRTNRSSVWRTRSSTVPRAGRRRRQQRGGPRPLLEHAHRRDTLSAGRRLGRLHLRDHGRLDVPRTMHGGGGRGGVLNVATWWSARTGTGSSGRPADLFLPDNAIPVAGITFLEPLDFESNLSPDHVGAIS
ncbi:MAG: WD40 repeat domain-containing protein [Planctomycetaceae bacterium]|nr:WD40 repeat domain-containing protein [Planctomycetaceae bacterium]